MNFNIYENLKNQGYCPDVILDIGSFKGEWSNGIKRVFNGSKIIAVDSNNYYENLNSCDYFFNETLSDKDNKEVIFYRTNHPVCIGTGDSIYKENSDYYSDDYLIKEIKKTKTIKTLLTDLNITKCDIIKLDTQGSELDILVGADDFVKKTDFIQIECSLVEYNIGGCELTETINYLYEKGFVLFDIFEEHRYQSGILFQVDFIFKNKNL